MELMDPDPNAATPAPRQRRAFQLYAFVVAVSLLILAAQNLPARLLALPADGLRDEVLNGTAGDGDFAAFTAARRRAFAWHKTAEYADELAAAYGLYANRPGIDDEQADKLLQQSLSYQTAALRLEPADSYGWAERAFLQNRVGADKAKAAAALSLSIETAPYEPRLMTSRLDMMIDLRDHLDEELQKQIPLVARQAWALDAATVAASAQEHNYVSVLQDALSDDDRATEQLHKMIPTP